MDRAEERLVDRDVRAERDVGFDRAAVPDRDRVEPLRDPEEGEADFRVAVARDRVVRAEARADRDDRDDDDRDDVPRREEFFDLAFTAICPLVCNSSAAGGVAWSRDCKFLNRMWGIIPAAGKGSRIQPLAFSKELLPVGSRCDQDGRERPRAVSEYLIERMLLAGVTKFCFVISPGKSDILEYYGGRIGDADVCYVVQSQPAGLCDALFCARPLIQPDDSVVIGLPDTIWFPRDGLARLPHDTLSFLLFPVSHPELFDAVVADEAGTVQIIQVKQKNAATHWIWGAFRLPGQVYLDLHRIWTLRRPPDEYIGTLVNAYLEQGGRAKAIRAGEIYVDVGTVHGYREALQALDRGQRIFDDADRYAHHKADSTEGAGTRIVVP